MRALPADRHVTRRVVGGVAALATAIALSGCGPKGGTVARPLRGTSPSASALSAVSSSPADDRTVCGPWSAAGASFAQGVARDHGNIESCFAYGADPTSWVITTDGVNGGPGYLGVDRCTTTGCSSGLTDHTADQWVFHRADRPGSVRLGAPPVAGGVLQVTVGGHEETFDLTSGRFGILSSIGPAGVPGLPITGTLQTVGGPPPGLPTNVPGTVRFDSSNGVTVTAPVGKDGRFTAAVPPGTYTVTGFSPRYYNGPCGGDTVTIPGQVPAPVVHVYCQMM